MWHVWWREGVHIGFWWINVKGRGYLEDTGVDWWAALNWVYKKWDGVIDWLDLPQDRDRWYDFVNSVMNLWVP